MAFLQRLFQPALQSARKVQTQGSRLAGQLSEFDLLAWDGTKTRIDAYDARGFVVNGTYLKGPVFLLPKNHFFWAPIDIQSIKPDHFSMLDVFHPQIELLLIGAGEETTWLTPALTEYLKKKKIPFETMSTRNAISTFNVLNQEDRLVAAGIIPLHVPPSYVHDINRLQIQK